jgi:hypothetical protein
MKVSADIFDECHDNEGGREVEGYPDHRSRLRMDVSRSTCERSHELTSPCSAVAAWDKKRKTLLVDNADGVTAHEPVSGSRIASYLGDQGEGYQKQVAFGERERVVVMGSERGKIFVFERSGGLPIDVLEHAAGGRVGRIAVSTLWPAPRPI